MSDYKNVFSSKAFIPFITAGDPDLETTKALIKVFAEEGASLVELGIPFSDPTAEGPVIQKANIRGMASGTKADDVFDMALSLRAEHVDIPLAIMTYANVVFSYGTDAFLSRMEEAGFSFLILPDVPYEEKREFSLFSERHGIALVSLVAPTSNERIRMIASDASGFIYCVSSLGVTGMRETITTDVGAMVRKVKEFRPDIPVAIGFGISSAETAKKMADVSDGVIIGSAIVNIIAEHGKDSPSYVREFSRSIVSAIRD